MAQAGGQDHEKAERPTGEAGHWPRLQQARARWDSGG